jgi:eukaryotic-like serine/threonine-protein kinase
MQINSRSHQEVNTVISLDSTNFKNPSAIAPNNNDNRYRLMERLGGGGMGNVYLAMDTRIGKPVAIKLLKESLADDESIRVRFEWELAICAALKSQHIVQVTDYGIMPEGSPFYVMEYLQGQTLAQLLAQEKQLSPQRAYQIVSQICAGLQIAHEGVIFEREGSNSGERIKVVHRDLKPENIFLVPTALGDLVKIIDFGIAKIRHFHTDCTNVTNVFLGTCHYASPEQINGTNNLDQRADIYNLGLILYEMLAGIDPFGFDFRQNSVAGESWLVAHTSYVPLPLRSHPGCGHLSPALEAVVMKCLKKSPKDRFDSASELSQALQAVILGETVKEAKLPLRVFRQATQDEETRDGMSFPPSFPPLHFKRAPIGIGAIAALAIGMFAMPKLLNVQTIGVLQTQVAANEREFSVVKTPVRHSDIIWTVALNADGQILVSSSEDRTIKVENPNTGQLTHPFSGYGDAVRTISLSKDGNIVVSAGSERTIEMRHLKTDKLIRTLQGHQDPVSADRRIKIRVGHDGRMPENF